MKAKTLIGLCFVQFIALVLYGVANFGPDDVLPAWYRAAAVVLAIGAFLSVLFGDPSD